MQPACHISSWVVTLRRKGKESEGLSAARTTAAAYIRNAYTSRAARRILINRAAAAGLTALTVYLFWGLYVSAQSVTVGLCVANNLRFALLNCNDLSGKLCPGQV